MSSRSLSRGRSRTRSKTPMSAQNATPPRQERSRHRSQSTPRRARSASVASSGSAAPQNPRNGHRERSGTRSRSRSQSPNRAAGRSYRERSFTRSESRDSRRIQSSKIVVEKLTKNVTEAHLREIFGVYGKIESLDLPLNRQFMTNRGTAYIIYDHPSASESAIAHMHEAQFDGAVITVSIVLPRRAFSRSPPPAKSDRMFARSGPPPRGPPTTRYRSPVGRRGGYGNPRRGDFGAVDDTRNGGHAHSRSPTPPRRRRRSYSYSRSPSRSPPRRRGPPARSPPRRRRRSPSYSSYSSYSRSRSRTRSATRSRSPNHRRREPARR